MPLAWSYGEVLLLIDIAPLPQISVVVKFHQHTSGVTRSQNNIAPRSQHFDGFDEKGWKQDSGLSKVQDSCLGTLAASTMSQPSDLHDPRGGKKRPEMM